MGRAALAAPAVPGTGRAALPLPVGLFPFVVIRSLLVVGYRLGGRQTRSGRSTPPKKYIYIHTKIQRYGSRRACSDAVLRRILPSLASQGARLLPAAHAASAARAAICAGCGGRLPSQGGNWPAAPCRDKVSAARGLGSSRGGGVRCQPSEHPGMSQLYRDEQRYAPSPEESYFSLFSPFFKGVAHLLAACGRVSHPSPANRLGTYWAAKFEDESYRCHGTHRISAEEEEVFLMGAHKSG